MSKNQLTLVLNGTYPEKLSVAKLGEYLSALSGLYGSEDSVHFESLETGSARIVTYVDTDTAYRNVIQRSVKQSTSNGGAFAKLMSLLNRDGLKGHIEDNDKVTIVDLPQRSLPSPFVIRKKTKVQGRLYSVGGKDDSVPVRLEGANGETYMCEAPPATAAELGKYLFQFLRVSGESYWEKKDSIWKLKKLQITSYEVLVKSDIKKAIKSLQDAPGNKWKEEEDPHYLANQLRIINCE